MLKLNDFHGYTVSFKATGYESDNPVEIDGNNIPIESSNSPPSGSQIAQAITELLEQNNIQVEPDTIQIRSVQCGATSTTGVLTTRHTGNAAKPNKREAE